MKKIIVFIAAVTISQFLLAQKCHYDIDKKDAFTGEQTNAIVHDNRGWAWTSMKQGSKFFIEMTFLHAGEILKPMTVKDSILIKFADGVTIHLNPMTDVTGIVKSQSYTNGGSTTGSTRTTAVTSTVMNTLFAPRFAVERKMYERLSTIGIVAIRMDFTGKPEDLDFTVRPLIKSVEHVINNAKCILSLN